MLGSSPAFGPHGQLRKVSFFVEDGGRSVLRIRGPARWGDHTKRNTRQAGVLVEGRLQPPLLPVDPDALDEVVHEAALFLNGPPAKDLLEIPEIPGGLLGDRFGVEGGAGPLQLLFPAELLL